eukprot:449617_1
MGCIQGIDHNSSSSKSPRINNTNSIASHPHSRCETSEPAVSDLESTPCSTDINNINNNNNTNYNKKPLKINTNISIQSQSNTQTINSNKVLKQRQYNGSNSLQSFTKQSIISTSATTIDGAILSHINHNRITPNYTIDEDVEEDNIIQNYTNEISPNNSPISPPKQQLVLQDNCSNTLCLNDDEINEYKSTLKINNDPITMKNMSMKSAPILPYKHKIYSNSNSNLKNINTKNRHKHYPLKRIKRSKSCDPDKQHNSNSNNNNNKLSIYAYNNKGQINTTKNKRKLVHAKSKSIPQNIFSSELGAYQTEETNNYEYLSQITHFDQNTLRLLHLRFKHIYKTHTFYYNTNNNNENNNQKTDNQHIQNTNNVNIKLDINAMSLILGLPIDCILVKRFFNYMDEHRMHQLSFRVFARTMSILSDKASINEKCELSFNLYDLNNDGVIDKNELTLLINDLLLSAASFIDPNLIKLINNNSETFINILITNTMKEFNLDINGNISYESYLDYMRQNQRLLAPFTLDIEKLLDFESEKRRMKRISINSLKKKKLRQMVIGTDPKKKYNKKWKKPQFLKDLSKDQIQKVNSISNPNDICGDLFDQYTLNEGNENESKSNDSEVEQKVKEEKLKQERMQRTIDFLYD